MVKQKILIHGIIEKEGKSGNKYYLVETNKGKMSCFPDYKGLKELKTAYANEMEIEVYTETSDDGRFTNIRDEKFTRKVGTTSNGVEETYFEPARKSVKGSAYEKDPVGLAVEVFNVIYGCVDKEGNGVDNETIMGNAIHRVKQAQKAFS